MRASELTKLLKVAIPAHQNVLITGSPGIGKTDIVIQVCEILKRELDGYSKLRLIITHPVVSDPTDYKGLPFQVNGEALFLPFNDLKELLCATVPTVFFIDDLGQAEPAVQKALMQLLWGGKLNGHVISPFVTFISATNRKEDKAGVMGILECVKSRFATIVNLEPTIEDWVLWAKTHDMPVELIAFVRFRERNNQSIFEFKPSVDMTQSCCPRTLASVGKWQKLGINPINPEHLEIIEGAIGAGMALEYRTFLINIKELPDIDELIKNADKFNTKGGYNLPHGRPDLAITICGALVHRINDKNHEAIVRIASKLDDEYSFMLMKDASDHWELLKSKKAFRDWVLNHRSYVEN